MSTGDDPQSADVTAGVADNLVAPEAQDSAVWPETPGPGAGGKSRKRKRRRRRRAGPADQNQASATSEASPSTPVPTTDQARKPNGLRTTVRHHTANGNRSAGPFYGALDLGTNNCRLLVATPRDRGFRVVDAFSRIVRLGEGIGASGKLGEDAMDRSIAALKVCGAKLAERDVRRARLIATEACRAAGNGREFVERVRSETGLKLEIVSRKVEARLAVAGCASLIDQTASGVILFDIGGGSSELVWIDLTPAPDGRRRRMADRIRTWQSLPVGVVNLSERHGGHHVTPAIFEDMVGEVMDLLDAFPQADALSEAVASGRVHMLGTSGTVTTLAGVHLGLQRYDRRRVDGAWLSGGEVESLIGEIAEMDYEARVAHPCIGRDRADLVVSGCAILEAIRRRWTCDRLRVADRGLREGVLVEMMAKDGVWRGRRRRARNRVSHG